MAHPYKHFADKCFWKKQVSETPWESIFSNEKGTFPIQKSDIVCTAGSCFASRISNVLKQGGFNYGDFEQPHPILPADMAKALGYGQYSARYGNVYTTPQLRQLIEEALGIRQPVYAFEQNSKGVYKDLQRPSVHGDGYTAIEEARADRDYHLSCVSRMLHNQDVFIYTLGLTEAWQANESGIVFGSHPSVTTGLPSAFDVSAVNFDYERTYADLLHALTLMRQVNPKVKFILTVSPVALMATHQNKHVLLATMYSKSVLRAVAGKIAETLENTDYFPSYELFNASQSFGQYLADDLRDVNMRGVSVAMNLFSKMYLQNQAPMISEDFGTINSTFAPNAPVTEALDNPADAECDEVLNALFNRR
jgi:GSCFA family